MPNRLSNETSPYLLQHQNNPVDWYPWGPEAFEKAAEENKPIFLSVGYSTCHWCHVMEHDSFEDQTVADFLNQNFVSVKVDREEHPDVDDVYMTAVQLGSGRGGWPMSVFLTPDKKPFFAGTYFPKEDRPVTVTGKSGQPERAVQPGFLTILNSVATQWKRDAGKLLDVAQQYALALRETREKTAPGTFRKWDHTLLEDAIRSILGDFDPQFGGFGPAPKFPPHSALELLMEYASLESAPVELREAALGASMYTLRAMALGGIHDHVGGGFHRYSTDERWLLPHFEKMLYDNALLLKNFVRASDIAGTIQPEWAQIYLRAANGIVNWLHTEMTSPDGLFHAALDADTEGEEGKFYVWTADEARAVLGDRYAAFAAAFGIQEEGNFADEATGEKSGANILHLAEEVGPEFDADLEALRQARSRRARPGLDHKGLVGWNGLMISALAEAGLLPLAERAAAAILEAEGRFGSLPHQVTLGQPRGRGLLEDYAGVVTGLIALAQARSFFEQHEESLRQNGVEASLGAPAHNWAQEAIRLLQVAVERFYDEEKGGFFATPKDEDDLFGRTKPVFDQPSPSPNALLLEALIATGDLERADKLVSHLVGWIERAPSACEALVRSALPLLPAATPTLDVPVVNPSEVVVKFGPRELAAGPDGWGTFDLEFSIPEGLHLNGNVVPARWLIPTTAEVQPLKAEIAWPEGDQYAGDLKVPVRVQLPSGSSGEEFEVRVKWQACTDSECFEPGERSVAAVLVRG